MTWLISGIVLFTAIHLFSALFPSLRGALKTSLGEKPFRGLYAALAAAGLALIVVGWRSTVPVAIYAPPTWGPTLTFLLMFVSIVLFGASHARTNIKRIVRHPQLTSIVLWSLAHLIANGDIRSIILFGSLGVWALLEMALINRREGEWVKPVRASMKSEMIGAAVSVVIFLVLIALHPYFAGVSPLPA
jgi:uncharacterized membrane protein